MTGYEKLANKLGIAFFDYQEKAFDDILEQDGPGRLCLYYRTGAGKSITALVSVLVDGHTDALVVAPPTTHKKWAEDAEKLGMTITTISHAAFRMKHYKISPGRAIIADEFHLFGGFNAMGWQKLRVVSDRLQAPLILLSATPNYNDAERVYCIQRLIQPEETKGGYLQFIYRHCETEQNPFGAYPRVLGLLHFKDASEFLASIEHVHHVPDMRPMLITEAFFSHVLSDEFTTYGYSTRKHRIMASQMEARYTAIYEAYVDEEDHLRDAALSEILKLSQGNEPVLLFCNSARLAEVVHRTLPDRHVAGLVTGQTKPQEKQAILDAFREGALPFLVGTATLATGTDGLDKVCDTLIIVQDTDDDSLRQQLVGRIYPRGLDADTSQKKIFRLNWIP